MKSIEEEIETKEFNDAFWIWFDELSPETKKLFNEYKSDMAKINFYNSIWKRIR